MAVLTQSKAPSSHWYRVDGTPVHKLPKADGTGELPNTIREPKLPSNCAFRRTFW